MDENVMVTRTLPIRRSPRNEELIHERVDIPTVEKLCVHELGEAVADPPPHPLTAGPDRVQIRVGREIVGIEAQGWGLYRVFVVGQVYEVRENPVTVLGACASTMETGYAYGWYARILGFVDAAHPRRVRPLRCSPVLPDRPHALGRSLNSADGERVGHVLERGDDVVSDRLVPCGRWADSPLEPGGQVVDHDRGAWLGQPSSVRDVRLHARVVVAPVDEDEIETVR